MFNRKIVVCGAGDSARNFLDFKPNDCWVKYIVDSDADKVGVTIHELKYLTGDIWKKKKKML